MNKNGNNGTYSIMAFPAQLAGYLNAHLEASILLRASQNTQLPSPSAWGTF